MSALIDGIEAAGRLFPLLVKWVVARFESGETEDEVARDIEDRTAEIGLNRRARDREFADKFGAPPE